MKRINIPYINATNMTVFQTNLLFDRVNHILKSSIMFDPTMASLSTKYTNKHLSRFTKQTQQGAAAKHSL